LEIFIFNIYNFFYIKSLQFVQRHVILAMVKSYIFCNYVVTLLSLLHYITYVKQYVLVHVLFHVC